ncbi:MAG: bifunctional DNA-formamidopyrimidine glycosylase/DNA-(apurinic or apyrimidinic site) lyase [Phycisphaerales bacterium]
MPELPEVEHLRRTLEPRLLGRSVVRATLHRRDVAVGPNDPPGGFARQRTPARPSRLRSTQMLEGVRVVRIDRRGKLLAVIGEDGRALGVHLGMTGQLLWAPAGGRLPTDHVHATWRLGDGSRLVFRDPRRFGGLWLAPSRGDLPPWQGLGPDALTLEPEALPAILAKARRPMKAALLDQRLLAGVGNIYADESLHRAGIHPGELACDVEAGRLVRLGRELAALLARAVRAGGSTLRDYRGAEGQAGAFQLQHAVYGRAGEPCRTCGRVLASGLLAQRTTVWCDACQRPQSTNELSTMARARAGGPMAPSLSTHSI